jgi:hypothetical protein
MLQRGVYKKSSYSVSTCVQAALLEDGTIGVKNSRDSGNAATHLSYTRAEWEAFIAGVKDGEFDYPVS